MDARIVVNGESLLTARRGRFLGGWEQLFTAPEGKEPRAIDWHEQDGLDVDLAEGIRLLPRKCTLQYYLPREEEAKTLVDFLQSIDGGREAITIPGYGPLTAHAIGARQYTPLIHDAGALVAVDVEQCRYPAPPLYPITPCRHRSALTLDGTPLHQLGAIELEGTSAAFVPLEGSTRQDGIRVETRDMDGAWVPPLRHRTRAAAEVEIPLLLTETTGERLRSTLYRLLRTLTAPGIRTLTYDGLTVRGYYRALDCTEIVTGADWFALCSLRLMRTTR